MVRKIFLYLPLLAVGLGLTAYAQTGSITGTVTDPSGAVIPQASVAATADATGQTYTAITTGSGSYTIANLPPTIYTVTVNKQNFQKSTYKGVRVTVAQVLPLNVQLKVSGAETVVNVSSVTEAPIETESYDLSTIIDSKKVQDLPLILRDPYQLAFQSPGVAVGADGGFAVNGSRDRNNNFMLDGADNNDTSVPGGSGGIVSANPDSIQEIRIITNNFDAQYGRNTGAVVDAVTRSGTNEIHGNVYEYGRYNAVGARDWFNRAVNPDGSTQKMNPYVRNDFGASVGGPIWKDHTFFYLNGEIQRFRTTLTNTIITPTPAFTSGVFDYDVPGYPTSHVDLTNPNDPNNLTGETINPVAQKIMSLYPAPNAGLIDATSGQYSFPSSSKFNAYTLTGKLDHKLTDTEHLMVRYVYSHSADPNPGHADILPGGVGTYSNVNTEHSGVIGLDSSFGARMANSIRASYNQNDSGFFCSGLGLLNSVTPFTTSAFQPGRDYSVPLFGTFGCGVLGDSNGQERLTSTLQLTEVFTYSLGTHTIKAGGEFRHIHENGYDGFGSRDTVTSSLYTDFGVPSYNLQFPATGSTQAIYQQLENQIHFLMGNIDNQSQSQFFNNAGIQTPIDFRRFRQHEYGLFVQDTWKALPNLTLSYGLRWEFNGIPYETDNSLSNLFVPANGKAPFTFTTVGPGTGKRLYANSWGLFEPRVGFAWDPFKDGKTSVRGGFGLYHDRIFGNLFGNSRSNPPFQATYNDYPILSASNFPTFSNTGFAPLQTPSATVQDLSLLEPVTFDPHMSIPANETWNLGVQRELPGNFVINANYVGNHSYHVLTELNGNQPDPGLVSQLVTYCNASPASCGVTNPSRPGESALQFSNLWLGYEFGILPYDAVFNNAFYFTFNQAAVAMSNYNAFQLQLTKRASHNLDFTMSYTWAHALDNASDTLVPGANNRGFPRNSLNLNEEYGNSVSDTRHRLTATATYVFPIGRGQSYLNSGILGRIMEGMQLSGIETAQSGQPFEIFSTTDAEHTGLSSRASYSGSALYPSGLGSQIDASGLGKRFGPAFSAFRQPSFDVVPTVRRNQFYGPHFVDTDLAFQKTQQITDRFKVVFRAEGYNVFNHPEFTNPQPSLGTPALFSLSTSTKQQNDGTTTARQLQGAIRLVF